MITDLNWQEQAICATTDVDVLKYFYTPDLTDDEFVSSEESARNTEAAKKVCGNCPVRLNCLQYALDEEERFGVWGGADETTRRWALSIDQYGKPISRVREMKCPNCEGTDITATSTTRVRTHMVCSSCDLSWWSRKIPAIQPIDVSDDRQDDNDDNLDEPF